VWDEHAPIGTAGTHSQNKSTLVEPRDCNVPNIIARINRSGRRDFRNRPVRLLGMGVSRFEDKLQQLGLWVVLISKKKHLQTTFNKLKDNFGEGAIRRGNSLK